MLRRIYNISPLPASEPVSLSSRHFSLGLYDDDRRACGWEQRLQEVDTIWWQLYFAAHAGKVDLMDWCQDG